MKERCGKSFAKKCTIQYSKALCFTQVKTVDVSVRISKPLYQKLDFPFNQMIKDISKCKRVYDSLSQRQSASPTPKGLNHSVFSSQQLKQRLFSDTKQAWWKYFRLKSLTKFLSRTQNFRTVAPNIDMPLHIFHEHEFQCHSYITVACAPYDTWSIKSMPESDST